MGARLYHSSLSVPPWPPREIHTRSPRTLPLFSVLYSRRPTTRRGPRPLLGVNRQRRSWDAAARPPGRGRAGTVSPPGMLASLGWGPITPRSASVSPLCSGGATPRWRGAALRPGLRGAPHGSPVQVGLTCPGGRRRSPHCVSRSQRSKKSPGASPALSFA